LKRLKREIWGYLFLLPWFIFFCIFTIYPFVYGTTISFFDYTLSGSKFVGFANYRQAFADSAFLKSVGGTFSYALIILPVTVAVSLWIANLLSYKGRRFNALVKALFYLPSVTSQVALVIVWNFLFSPTFGLVSSVFKSLGLAQISWFDSPATAIPLLALLICTYGLGQPIILYTAAINGIPESYFEAARIDGATDGQVFRQITLPLLKPTTTYVLITNTIGVLQIFAVPYLMTNGGPNNRTSTLLMMIYKSAFQNGNFGYASAIGVILFLITAVIAAAQFRAMRGDTHEY
jgi:multiple sugar transport system permease protein